MGEPFKLLFFGDFAAQNPQKIIFGKIINDIINSATISVCNFEAPVENSGLAMKKSGSILKQPLSNVSFLESKGMNFIQLANNHIMDYGISGLLETKKAFEKANYFGAGSITEAYKPVYYCLAGLKIAFLAFSHNEFGAITSDNEEYGVAWINHKRVDQIIRNTKKECDYLIVMTHAGVELINLPLPEWRYRYKEFVDFGADVIIGSHPHVPQGWEYYNGKPIFYSLGNFYFDLIEHNHKYWNYGIAVEMIIDNDVNFLVHPFNVKQGLIEITNSKEFKDYIDNACALLSDDVYDKYVDDLSRSYLMNYVISMRDGVGMPFIRGNLRQKIKYLLRRFCGEIDYPLLLNLFQCESHRWFIERGIKSGMLNG